MMPDFDLSDLIDFAAAPVRVADAERLARAEGAKRGFSENQIMDLASAYVLEDFPTARSIVNDKRARMGRPPITDPQAMLDEADKKAPAQIQAAQHLAKPGAGGSPFESASPFRDAMSILDYYGRRPPR
jgi:hypothetical protein